MNRKHQPLFMMNDHEGSRPSRLLLIIAMLVLLAVVLVVSFKIITPPGTGFGFSNRHARHQLAEAERLERNSLFLYAAEIYAAVVDNPKLNEKHRRLAAMRLAVIYSENLPDSAKAEVALEKAYVLYPDGHEREILRQRLESLRGHPLVKTEPSSFLTEEAAGTDPQKLIARIGNRSVSFDEIIFAWHEYNGPDQPEGPVFAEFVNHYLNLVLLAQKAQELKLDQRGRSALDLELKRITVLNSALTQYMIEKLPAPDAETLAEFYQANVVSFTRPASAEIGHIVAGDETAAKKAMAALKEGEDSFEAIAKRYSLDAGQLEDACRLGEIYAGQRTLPGLGDAPGLASRLVAMEDGATTGPLATDRGIHWVKVYQTHPAAPIPLDALDDKVLRAYQKKQLMLQRTQLLAALKKQYSIEIFKMERPAEPVAEKAPQTEETQPDDAATTTTTTAGEE